MTNGEKIKQMFPNAEYTTDMCTCVNMRPLKDGEWASKFGWSFDIDWWNAEYKEPKEIHLIPIGDKPNMKFADQIIKEMDERGEVKLPDGCIGGEHFERFLNRDCEKCKHRIPTVDIVKGKSTYGCELWECKFEQKERVSDNV